jgi:hypothetical protein
MCFQHSLKSDWIAAFAAMTEKALVPSRYREALNMSFPGLFRARKAKDATFALLHYSNSFLFE